MTKTARPKGNPVTKFRLGNLNHLGFSHTQPGGNASRKYPNGIARARTQAKIIAKRHLNVMAHNEFQSEQRVAYMAAMDGWGIHALGDNAMTWKKSKWHLVDKGSIHIRYFGAWKAMPWVVLEARKTGDRVAFLAIHTPRRGRSTVKARRNGWKRMARWATAMAARDDVKAALVAGDFNAKAVPLVAFMRERGGQPTGRPEGRGIDWAFYWGELEVLKFVTVDNDRLGKTTDHPIIITKARA